MQRDTFNYSKGRILAAVDEVIEVSPDHDGTFICVQVFAVTDQDNQPTQVDFGYNRGGVFTPYYTILAPAANQTILFPNEFYMILDDKPAIRITGGTIGDHIQLTIGGYVGYKDPPGA